MSLDAVEPMMEILLLDVSANMDGFMRDGSEVRVVFEAGVETVVAGRRTEVMMMCGIRWTRCKVEIAAAREA